MNSLLPIAASCLLAGGAIGYVVGNNGGEGCSHRKRCGKGQCPGGGKFAVGGALQAQVRQTPSTSPGLGKA